MKKWKACSLYFGDGEAKYTVFDFDIPNKLYDRLMKAVEKTIPIQELSCYGDLVQRAEKALDGLDIFDLEMDKPEREDFDSTEEFQEAMDEYLEDCDDVMGSWYLERFEVEDPGDRLRLIDRFSYRQIAEAWDLSDNPEESKTYSETLENDAETYLERYDIDYTVDHEGHMIDFSVYSEGFQSEGIRSSSWEECFPDYEFINDYFEELEECQ